MTRVLVTGASGFIGSALTQALRAGGASVRTAARRPLPGDHIQIGELSAATDWTRALQDVSTIVHLAGPAHARSTPEGARAITEGAAHLARQAAILGVSRFIYMSSLHAAAKRTRSPVAERETPAPEGIYGRAKLAAEAAVLAHPELNAVILRPPLVFAPDAKANFALLLRVADTGAPLPVINVRNQRSLISRDSVVEAVRAVLAAPSAKGGVFFLADRPALSTAEIIEALRNGLGRAPNLFAAGPLYRFLPAPLRESLVCDDSVFRAAFGYGPRQSADVRADLAACARAWKAAK